jgi:L-histidine N-alpha-methyltransferase
MQTAARLSFVKVGGSPKLPSFREAVEQGLGAPSKSLPPRFFYDARGSALFEAITVLPEYYLTRAEDEIFQNSAQDLAESVGEISAIVEFGSGSSTKTRRLLDAFFERQNWLKYVPIDISHDFLAVVGEDLLKRYPMLEIEAIGSEYHDAIEVIPSTSGARLFLFLGSNIGNFAYDDAVGFLCHLRGQMKPSDRLLLGVDRVKSQGELWAAYNDSAGVTAEFNLNLLVRINRELDGDFEVGCFQHEAEYDPESERIEMRLRSRVAQDVWIGALGRSFSFGAGEAIHTEWSHKYSDSRLGELVREAGFVVAGHWDDSAHRFSEYLLRPDIL